MQNSTSRSRSVADSSEVRAVTHQPKLTMFEVTQSPMNQSGGPARGSAADIAFVQQDNFQPSHGSIARDAGAVDAGADNDQVECFGTDVAHCYRLSCTI